MYNFSLFFLLFCRNAGLNVAPNEKNIKYLQPSKKLYTICCEDLFWYFSKSESQNGYL